MAFLNFLKRLVRRKKPQGVEKFNVRTVNANEYSVTVIESDGGKTEVVYGVFNPGQIEEIRRIRRAIQDEELVDGLSMAPAGSK